MTWYEELATDLTLFTDAVERMACDIHGDTPNDYWHTMAVVAARWVEQDIEQITIEQMTEGGE